MAEGSFITGDHFIWYLQAVESSGFILQANAHHSILLPQRPYLLQSPYPSEV